MKKQLYSSHEFYFLLQVFPGTLLPYNYADPQNPDHLLARSEVERRRDYIQPLHVLVGEEHPLVQLVHQCLHNTPARRPSAEELLQQLEAVRAQIEGPYGQSVRVTVDMEKVRALREKDTEIRRLQQQMHQLEVGNVYTCNIKIPLQTYKWGMTGLYNVLALHSFPYVYWLQVEMEVKDTQLQQKDGQIQRQGTELRERTLQHNRQLRELRVRKCMFYCIRR